MYSIIESEEMETPVDRLLKEQQKLNTPVARFSEKHQNKELDESLKTYSDLIPLEAPQPGEQFAFEVDLDNCTGCKSCVSACHSLNGLEEEETWRDVGLIHSRNESYQQTVTTACHHCIDPGCLNGCPVNAYEKDDVTGIVMHLDDQCIGCEYCVFKCPYEVPKYSDTLGIVRKCDMCHSRLTSGEAPACVQACPNEAIKITIVKQDLIEEECRDNADILLPDTPDAAYTAPTTRYTTKKDLPANSIAADHYTLRPQHTHLPLVIMLVLVQASVGLASVQTFLSNTNATLNVLASILCLSGLSASILHLGKPLKAWRVFLGLGKSWLSREIVSFSAFMHLLVAQTAVSIIYPDIALLPYLNALTIASGIIALGTSIMVYHDTPKSIWNFKITAPQFIGSTIILGSSAFLLFGFSYTTAIVLGISSALKLLYERFLLSNYEDEEFSDLKSRALVMLVHARGMTITRYSTTIIGGILVPVFIMPTEYSTGISIFAFTLCLIGEFCERILFFKSSASPKMPGGIVS